MPAKKPAGKAAKPAAKAAKPAAKQAAPAAKAPSAPASTGKSVYIKNLAFPGLSHETVKAAFKSCGNVSQVQLRRKKYCILHFNDAAAAGKAKELNGKTVKGSKITVEAAKKGPEPARSEYCTSVFVGGLSKMPRKDARAALKKQFTQCGNVVKIRTYSESSGMHAFVYFADNAAAKKAVTTMDRQSLSKPFGKRPIQVAYSIRTKAKDQKAEKVRQTRIALKKAAKKAKKAQ
eukprot:TRINITY_DN1337_c0_g1_i2.p3 TRINITY_DN1337_c0_g1~~TRINITY_DN1337_c0_g1_i2.p3  ORF type:complete len:265 (+),score=141.50 TRINITY_DN1337_c0_g1_i2:99-797(+)